MAMTDENTGSSAGEIVVSAVSKVVGDELDQKTIIDECDFKAERGKLTALVGPSGCGKTTLINLIAGYDPPTSGSVLLDNTPIAGASWDRLVVFQESALFPWMSVYENVAYGPRVRFGATRRNIRTEVNSLLTKFGLKEFSRKYPKQLSGGMQRRAELARVLINRPRVLLMDEPFRGLDAMTREFMQEYLLRLFEGSNQTIIFVTTEVDEAILIADKIVLLTCAPARVKCEIEVGLPRPRKASVIGSSKFVQIKQQVLSQLYAEAMRAFSSGSRAAADLVEAYESHQRSM